MKGNTDKNLVLNGNRNSTFCEIFYKQLMLLFYKIIFKLISAAESLNFISGLVGTFSSLKSVVKATMS